MTTFVGQRMIFANFNSGMLNGVTDINVYYHADCTDGLLAAAACYDWYLKTDEPLNGHNYTQPIHKTIPAWFTPYKYGMIPKKLGVGDLLILVDFSFDLQTIEQLLNDGVKICILDHHEPRVFELNHLITEKRVWGILTTKNAGCVLSYIFFKLYANTQPEKYKNKHIIEIDYFEHTKHLPKILKHAQDRDLWIRKLPDTDNIMLGFYETVHDVQTARKYLDDRKHNEDLFAALCVRGKTSKEIRDKFLQEALANKFYISFVGESGTTYKLPCVNLPESFRSEACQILHTDTNDVGASLTIMAGGMCKISMRSKGDPINIIALDMGGGGHPKAAGFETHISNITFLENLE